VPIPYHGVGDALPLDLPRNRQKTKKSVEILDIAADPE